ncbi:MAG: AAA family ATPase [Nitrospira sp.]|jgi:chloramphenicol 3-O phosphotransferase|nr:AAA family ATPase [Nitrospira sp.]
MVSPHIICLNGTSSSGKTSIAKQLQELLPTVYLNFSIDSILYTLPPSAFSRMTHGQDISDLNYPQLVRSYNACIALLAEMGHFLVIDNAMDRTEQAIDLLERVKGYSILLVGVHCSLEELNRRERQRRDRTIGEAAAQFNRVHRGFVYDVEVDSSTKSPSELAVEIMNYLKRVDVLQGRDKTMTNIRSLRTQ